MTESKSLRSTPELSGSGSSFLRPPSPLLGTQAPKEIVTLERIVPPITPHPFPPSSKSSPSLSSSYTPLPSVQTSFVTQSPSSSPSLSSPVTSYTPSTSVPSFVSSPLKISTMEYPSFFDRRKTLVFQKGSFEYSEEIKNCVELMSDHVHMIIKAYPNPRELVIYKELIQKWKTAVSKPREYGGERYHQEVNDALIVLNDILNLKKSVLKETLEGAKHINLTPGEVSRMINKTEYFVKVFKILSQDFSSDTTKIHMLEVHCIWLSEMMNYTNVIKAGLDITEAHKAKMLCKVKKIITQLYLKANEYHDYIKSGVESFPALVDFNVKVGLKIRFFLFILVELQKKIKHHVIFSKTDIHVIDHMIKEIKYYLNTIGSIDEPLSKSDLKKALE